MLTINDVTVLTPDERLERQQVRVEGETITGLEAADGAATPETVAGGEWLEASGYLLVPGFIDLQINGGFGQDFTATPDVIWEVAAGLPRWGVTAFLPTIVTSPPETITQARRVLAEGRPEQFRGAEPLGLHVEGPFLNPEKKGAHNPRFLRAPEPALYAALSPATGVRLVTLAPELPGAMEIVRTLVERGIVVSAGHTMATYAEALAAFDAGIRYGTHIFNVMPPYHQHEPGMVGALLDDERVHFGLIADGIHVHPAVVRMLWQTAGERLTLVTDAMAALGAEPGLYELGEIKRVRVDETSARLLDGTLAGSILSLDQALRNLIEMTGCTLAQALPAVTSRPAALLGMGGSRGRIAPGARADLVLLSSELEVALTVVGGEVVYRNRGLLPEGSH